MDLSTPSNAGNKGNVIKNVESDKYVTLDNVALTSAQADIQLTNAIQAGDLDRTKYILDSGVNVAFTDDAICVTADTSGFHVAYQDMVMPKTMEDARQMLARFNGGIFITSSCSKLFLYRASLQLKNSSVSENIHTSTVPFAPVTQSEPNRSRLSAMRKRDVRISTISYWQKRQPRICINCL